MGSRRGHRTKPVLGAFFIAAGLLAGSAVRIGRIGGELAVNPNPEQIQEGDLELIVVDITLEPEFQPGTPRVLFEGRFIETSGYGRNYDVAPDGQSFLMIQQNMAGIEAAELRMVLNWLEELKQQVSSER